MTIENPNPNGEGNEPKLYAGKFKTLEDLENGYKNSAIVYDENEKLKKQLEEVTKIPDTYLNPADVELDQSRLPDIQARAKESGMTQKQYEAFVRADKLRVDKYKSNFEAAKKDVGEETMNLLSDYVSKHYPKELHDNMLNTFIGNKEARTAALNHRQQLLSNQVPGMGKVTPPNAFNVTDEDVKKAYVAKEANKHDLKARNHYLNVLNARAAQQAG
jgi:hypothetical protein